ncbi:hypothetical protein AURDEDRAFT_125292 [Auricularia subglabra TFB-10046 SS5]|nr:hypothetical protein AURDEDRAFT_125292 [Auricularia subglabra TFB-10046 SS5]
MAPAFNMYFNAASVYVDRTVLPREADREQKKVLMNRLETFGARTVFEALDAHILLVDPTRAIIDSSYDDIRAMIVDYAYVAKCFDNGEAIPIANYLVRENPRGWGAAQALSQGYANPPGSWETLLLMLFLQQSSKNAVPAPASVQDTPGSRRRASGSNTKTPPVPSCSMAGLGPFENAEAQEWACEFVRWYLRHTYPASETPFLRDASAQMAKIVVKLSNSTFFNSLSRIKAFKKDIRDLLAECKADRGKDILSAEELRTLLRAARTSYQNAVKAGR